MKDRPCFFEIPKGSEPAGNHNAIGAMQHCAFVVTAERFRQVEARLKSRGIDYIGPIPLASGVIACITKVEAPAELATLPAVTPEWITERLIALRE